MWQQHDPVSETNIIISKSLEDAVNQQQRKNNLWFLNKELLTTHQ
jgi:hypothetical protein